MKLSECCNTQPDQELINDFGICPECKEECWFKTEADEPSDDQIFNNFCHEGGIRFKN
jgi:hypothetical protein